MECGAQSVVTCGTIRMLQSYVDNWATHSLVSVVTKNLKRAVALDVS